MLVQPGTGDDVQMLKAGILEIGDVFVVNKADLDGVDRTVHDLREMIRTRADYTPGGGSHAEGASQSATSDESWEPQVVETVATNNEGVDDLIDLLVDHADFLDASGERSRRARRRYAEEIRTLLRAKTRRLTERSIEAHGGIDELAAAIERRETDPYTATDELIEPIETCFEQQIRTVDDKESKSRE